MSNRRLPAVAETTTEKKSRASILSGMIGVLSGYGVVCVETCCDSCKYRTCEKGLRLCNNPANMK